MIPLIRNFLHDLLWSPERASLWLRGLIITASQVLAGLTANQTLPLPAEWSSYIAGAGLILAVLVKAGEKNAPPK